MYVIDAVLTVVGPEVTVTVETLDDANKWLKEHRPKFGFWDWFVVDPDGNTVPNSHFDI